MVQDSGWMPTFAEFTFSAKVSMAGLGAKQTLVGERQRVSDIEFTAPHRPLE